MGLLSHLKTHPSLIEYLYKKGTLTFDQIHVVQKEQHTTGKDLYEILLTFHSEEVLLKAKSELSGYPIVHLSSFDHFYFLPEECAREHLAIVFNREGNTFHIAMDDPEDILAKDALRNSLINNTDLSLQDIILIPYHAARSEIESLLFQMYLKEDQHSVIDQSIITIVQEIIEEALYKRASDIHFQCQNSFIRICFRIDGLLEEARLLHKTQWPSLCVKLKILAGLDISETRRPQNGAFAITLAGRAVDFRLSCHPTIEGENLVLRILDKTSSLLDLEELGFFEKDILYLKQLIQNPQGMVIFSGATGSGKTTTLYALLRYMDVKTKNIMTLEQPVEYKIPGIRQTDIKEDGIIGFEEGIRSILRQDPDVIFIGEIRDEATAQMALRASMTGHLILSTLHTHDAFTVPARLHDLGLKIDSLSSALLCVVSQRLIRLFCKTCYGKGCSNCHHKGFKGRQVIAEFLKCHTLQEWDEKALNPKQLKHYALSKGTTTLYQHGQYLVDQGLTSQEELQRVAGFWD